MVDLQPLRPDEPRQVGSCTLIGRLDVGPQGRAFLGRAATGTPVVVRLLDPDWVATCGGRTPLAMRLVRARLVDSPRVARIIEAQLGGGEPYLVTEYIEGPSLDDIVRARGPVPADGLHELAIDTATALAAVHRVGLRYGDLTAARILLGPGGSRLIDLGLANGSASVLAGCSTSQELTPPGGARLEATPVDPSEDLFAWARTITFAAGGRLRPGNAATPNLLLAVRACLAAEPADRPSATEVLATLTDESAQIAAPVGAALFVPSTRSAPSASSTVQVATQRVAATQVATPPVSTARVVGAQVSGAQVSGTRVVGARVVGDGESVTWDLGPRTADLGPASAPFDDRFPPAPGPPRASSRDVPGRGHRRPRARRVLTLAGVATTGLVIGWFLGAGAAAEPTASSGRPVISPAPPSSGSTALAGGGSGAGSGSAAAPGGATCSARYQVVEQWPGGFKGQVTVTAGGTPLGGWRLNWTFAPGQAITQWWNSGVTTSGMTVVAQNSATNGAVPAHGATTFVFLGTYRTANPPPPVTCLPG
jgi:hypothetical protein